jgi:thioredoxin 1
MKNLISENTFKEQVMLKQGLHIVNFFAGWNGPSQMMLPVFAQLAESYNNRSGFYSVDIDKNPLLKAEYGIMELPTILFFDNGKLVDHISGIISKSDFIAKLENTLMNKM